MNAKKIMALALALVMALSLCACGGGSTTTEPQGEQTAAGGNLKVHIETEVASLDSAAATDGTSFEVIADFTDGLMQPDADGNPIKALAKDVQVSDDGLTYTFTLRDDATWVDSTGAQYADVTAQDFVFAWQRAADPDFASEYNYMISDVGQIKNGAAIVGGEMTKDKLGVTAKDDKTLVVELEAPVPYFLSLMYFPTFYPVNQKFCEQCGGTYGTSAATVLSNGAFIMGSDYQAAATSFNLTKNAAYYDASRISLEGLSYQVIKDPQTALLAYQNKNLDVVTLSGEQVAQVKDDPEFTTVNAGYLWYVTVNQSKYDYLANVNMRKALSAAFDRQALVDTVIKDGSTAATFAVPEGLAAGPDGKDYRETATKYDMGTAEDAQKYYAEACKDLGKSSFDIELLVEDDAIAQNVASYIKEQWEKLSGVKVTLKVETKKQRVEDIQNGSYNTCLTRWGPDYADPMTYLGMWVTNNPNNYGLWSNSEYDALIADCTTGKLALDAAARWDALKKAEDIVMDQMVILPVYQKNNAMMIRTGVKNVECHPVALNRVFKNVTIG